MRNGGRSLEKNPGISNLSIWLNSDQYMKKKKKIRGRRAGLGWGKNNEFNFDNVGLG